MNTVNFPGLRRRRLLYAIGGLSFGIASCATTPPPPPAPPPVEINAADIDDVPSLIAAMKVGAGSQLPANVPTDSFYKAFARSFVEYARDAAERYNIPIPQWVLSRLPPRKVALPAVGILLIVRLAGVTFRIPITTFFSAMLKSILTMTPSIYDALRADRSTQS